MTHANPSPAPSAADLAERLSLTNELLGLILIGLVLVALLLAANANAPF